MFHDSFCENFLDILWHNGAQYLDKINVSQFSTKNILLEQYGPTLTQNCTTCINCSKDFKKYFSIMESNSQTSVILVNFPRKFPFAARCNLGQSYANLLSQDFLKLRSMMGHKRPIQCWSTFLINFLLLDRTKTNLGQNYATLCDDLLLHCCKIEHNKHTKVIVSFNRKYLLGKMGNSSPI